MTISFTIHFLSISSLDWPHVGTFDHVLGDIRLWVQVSVHVRPSLILGNLIYKSLITVLFSDLCLLIGQINFIIQEVLCIGKVLDSPGILLSLKVLGNEFIILNLLGSGCIDIINRLWFQPFEMVWNISMGS